MNTRVPTTLILAALGLAAASGCRDRSTAAGPDNTVTTQGVRVINGYTQAIDVLVDGEVAVSSLAPGQLDSIPQSAGAHTVALRPSGGAGSASVSLTVGSGALSTIAAVRSGAALSASALDDTSAVVPTGATKVRVLHLAPNAGEIQVFRTQPDWSTPIEWQFPFLYDSAAIDPLANPYFQSTVGTWDVRAWLKPSEVALGWDGTTARVTFALGSGEKRTVLVLDKPGGGIQLSVIE